MAEMTTGDDEPARTDVGAMPVTAVSAEAAGADDPSAGRGAEGGLHPLAADAPSPAFATDEAAAPASTGDGDRAAPAARARWVSRPDEVDELARLILDPAREMLVVAVTKQPTRELPMLDPEALARALGDRAQVWVVGESEDAWALTEALPNKVDVYGGAVRAWVPIEAGAEVFPSDHPQWTVFSEEDGPRVIEQIVAFAALADDPPPPFGTESLATVTGVRKAGAELLLDSGHEAFAAAGHLIQHGEVFHAAEIVQLGQEVRVRVGPWHAQAAKVSVSLRDFAPDPWERFAEVHGVGDTVDGVVARLLPYGAIVELLPGVQALLHISRISQGYVDRVDDELQPGDRIAVAVLSIDLADGRAEVSIVDAGDPAPPMSVYPGGPPWLPEGPEFAEDEPGGDRGADADGDRGADVERDADSASGVSTTSTGADPLAQFEAQAADLVAAAERLLGDEGVDPGDPRLSALRIAIAGVRDGAGQG